MNLAAVLAKRRASAAETTGAPAKVLLPGQLAPARPVDSFLAERAAGPLQTIIRYLGDPSSETPGRCRGLQLLWSEVGTQMKAVPAARRDDVTRLCAERVASLCEALGRDPCLGAAVSCLVAMVAHAARSDCSRIAELSAAAELTVATIARRFVGRTGGHLALFALRNMADTVHLRRGTDAASLPVAWSALADYTGAGLLAGPVTQTDISGLTETLTWSLEGAADVPTACAQAVAERRDAYALELEDIKAAVRRCSSDARYRALQDAAVIVLARFPDGPCDVWRYVRSLVTHLVVVKAPRAKLAIAAELLEKQQTPADALQTAKLLRATIDGWPGGWLRTKTVHTLRQAGDEWPAMLLRICAPRATTVLALGVLAGIEPSSHRTLLVRMLLQERAANPMLALSAFADARASMRCLDVLDDEQLERFAERLVELVAVLPADHAREAGEVAYGRIGQPRINNAGDTRSTCRALVDQIPGVRLAPLLLPTAQGAVGVFDVRQGERQHAPVPLLRSLLAGAVDVAGLTESGKERLARLLMAVALELASLDRDPSVFATLVRDALGKACSAANDETPLLLRAPAAVASASVERITGFAQEHPTFPPELVIPAVVHLEAKTLAWLARRMAACSTNVDRRSLRDLTVAAILAKRTAVLDVLRERDAVQAFALAAVVNPLHRIGNDAQVPWDEIQNLQTADGDAGAILQERELLEADGDLEELPDLSATNAAAANDLATAKSDIKILTAFLKRASSWEDIPAATLRHHFNEVLAASGRGDWPARKYNDPAIVAGSAYALLSPEKQLFWRNGFRVDGPPPERPNLGVLAPVAAMAERLAGQVGAIADAKYGARSLRACNEKRADLVQGLRALTRDSAAYLAASREVAVLTNELALRTFERAAAGVATSVEAPVILPRLGPLARDAANAARKLGNASLVTELRDLAHAVLDLPPPPPSGRIATAYASSQTSVTAFLTSFRVGCMNPSAKHNAPALIEFMLNPDYQMALAYDHDVAQRRGVLRLFKVEMQGYSGPALYVDSPYATAHGVTQTREAEGAYIDLVIMMAKNLGVPALMPESWRHQMNQVADVEGMACSSKNVKIFVPFGVIGVHQSEAFSSYFIKPKPGVPHTAKITFAVTERKSSGFE